MFTTDDLRLAFDPGFRRWFSTTTNRWLEDSLLERARRGIYVNWTSQYINLWGLKENIAKVGRRGHAYSLSLKSLLCEYRAIFQIMLSMTRSLQSPPYQSYTHVTDCWRMDH